MNQAEKKPFILHPPPPQKKKTSTRLSLFFWIKLNIKVKKECIKQT